MQSSMNRQHTFELKREHRRLSKFLEAVEREVGSIHPDNPELKRFQHLDNELNAMSAQQ